MSLKVLLKEKFYNLGKGRHKRRFNAFLKYSINDLRALGYIKEHGGEVDREDLLVHMVETTGQNRDNIAIALRRLVGRKRIEEVVGGRIRAIEPLDYQIREMSGTVQGWKIANLGFSIGFLLLGLMNGSAMQIVISGGWLSLATIVLLDDLLGTSPY